ncbi:MAG: DUF1003 domain-containing protein [Deltaproteobacteria bacterium]|nr:DUF1003 domain-containing protein [Deltaproteobacteria bacterium]
MAIDEPVPSCQLCGTQPPPALRRAAVVRAALRAVAEGETGRPWDDAGWICASDLERLRRAYVERLVREDRGEIGALEAEVLESLRDHEILARQPDEELDQHATRGQRVADRIATFGGSWRFIGIFTGFLVAWMVLNGVVLATRPFDPYPFILLNLVLSCLAAVQAPVIMLSQNRQETRDRARASHDYQVNLKAELEVRLLHQKLDHLISHQWDRLLEIQELQLELMEELRDRAPDPAPTPTTARETA